MAVIDFHQLFDAYMAANQKKWGHDRNKTLGGSETFGCLRKAWYTRNNTPKDDDWEDSWGATERGNIIENHFVVPAMDHAASEGHFNYLLGGDNQNTFFDTDSDLSVTPDGLITGVTSDALAKYGIPDIGSDCFCLEIKSIDPRVDLSEEKAIHHGQTQIQMGLIRQNMQWKPNYSVILYINASFLNDIEVFVVKFDQNKFEVARDRAALVFKTKDPSTLMREGVIDGSCQYCPFQQACLGTTSSAMPKKDKKPGKVADALRVDLEPLLSAKRAAALAEKKANTEHETLKEQIKEVLRRHGVSNPKDKEAGWSVSYGMQNGRISYDYKAMEADGIDLEPYVKEGNRFEVLRVTFKDAVPEDE